MASDSQAIPGEFPLISVPAIVAQVLELGQAVVPSFAILFTRVPPMSGGIG